MPVAEFLKASLYQFINSTETEQNLSVFEALKSGGLK